MNDAHFGVFIIFGFFGIYWGARAVDRGMRTADVLIAWLAFVIAFGALAFGAIGGSAIFAGSPRHSEIASLFKRAISDPSPRGACALP